MSDLKQLVLKIISDYYDGKHRDLIFTFLNLTSKDSEYVDSIFEENLQYYVYIILRCKYYLTFEKLVEQGVNSDIIKIFRILNIDD